MEFTQKKQEGAPRNAAYISFTTLKKHDTPMFE
jgi:hypothetical protein